MAKRSLESELIVDELKTCYERNEIADYKRLENCVPECTTRRRSLLSRALNIVASEYGYLFENVSSVGYAPMAKKPVETISRIEAKRVNKIKSQVNKFENELDTIDYSKLNKHEKEKYFAAQARLSVHQMVVDNRYDEVYANAGKKCANSGKKIEFSLMDASAAFRALSMA